jgi:beta-lactam-binding protein with PASTA domain
MAFNPMSLVLGSVLAEREGVTDPQARIRIALLGGLFGSRSPITGLALTTVFARREAESTSAPALTLVQVPNEEGRNITEAERELRAFGLNAVSRDGQSSTIPNGSVISQDPPAFSLVLEGATVTLAVSQAFELPDVTNDPLADAEQKLESLGLQVKRGRRRQNSETILKGHVIAQQPPADTLVSRGDTVTLTISKGPERAPVE